MGTLQLKLKFRFGAILRFDRPRPVNRSDFEFFGDFEFLFQTQQAEVVFNARRLKTCDLLPIRTLHFMNLRLQRARKERFKERPTRELL